MSELSSGDRATDYIAFLCVLVLAFAVTLAWSIADRGSRGYPRLHAALRVYVRYALGAIMLMYGVVKLFKGQFGAPSLEELIAPLGEFAPMGLLWMFMGHSAPYTFFAGLIETVGGVLLFFERTTLLGALTVAAAMLNVVVLNLSYNVTVKLYSLQLLFWALFLTLPDATRLFDFFIRHRPTAPRAFRPLFVSARATLAARAAQVVAIAFAVYTATSSAIAQVGEYGDDLPKHPLFGIYDVTSFLVNGEPAPPLLTDARRWRKVIIGAKGHTVVRTMTDSGFALDLDAAAHTFVQATRDGRKNVFLYSEPAPAELALEGNLGDDAIALRLKRFDETELPLLRERFRWINPKSLE